MRYLKALLIAVALVLLVTPAEATVGPFNVFTPFTTISSTQVNANFTTIANQATDKRGDTFTGTMNTQHLLPALDATYDVGQGGSRYRNANFSGTITTVGLTATNATVTALTLTSLSAPLSIANGGTNGSASPTLGGVVYGTGTAYAVTAAGASGQVLTSVGAGTPQWANGGVPAGMIMFAAGGTCPTGWSEFTALRGRYPVGLPNGGTNQGTDGTALSNLEDRPTGQHTHTITDPGHTHSATPNAAGWDVTSNDSLVHGGVAGTPVGLTVTIGSSTTGITINNAGAVASTNAPYIQLIACQKS